MIEAVGSFGQIATGVLGLSEGVVAPADGAFEVGQQDIDPACALDFGGGAPATGDQDGVGMILLDDLGETRQAVAEDFRALCQSARGEVTERGVVEGTVILPSDPVMRSVDPRDRALPTDGSRQSTASDSPRASRHAPACSTTSKLTTIETACTRLWAISPRSSSSRKTLLRRVSVKRGQDQIAFTSVALNDRAMSMASA